MLLTNSTIQTVLLVISLSAVLLSHGYKANLNPSEWASWVQAVGSIIAIAGAFAIGKHQADVQRKVAEQARRDLVSDRHSTVKGVFDRVFQLCLNVEAHITYQGQNDIREFAFIYIETHVPAAQRLLDEIPLHELGSAELVHATLDMKEAMQSFLSSVELYRRRPTSWQEGLPISVDQAIWFLQEQIDDARDAYNAAIAVTGGTPRSTAKGLLGHR